MARTWKVGDTLRRAQRVVELIRQAALRGWECPSNAALARLLDVSSHALIVRAINEAEWRKLIVVQRFATSRIVSAPDGTWRTADPANTVRVPHYTRRDWAA